MIVVTLLALPFVFGPLRTTGAGTRTVIGVMLGVVFFLITRTIENGGSAVRTQSGAGGLAADRRHRFLYACGDIENALGRAPHAARERFGFSTFGHAARVFGVEIEPQHAERCRRPGEHAIDEAQSGALSDKRPPDRCDGAKMPGAHPQGLAAASPIEHVIARDHGEQSRAIQIHPGPAVARLDRGTLVQEQAPDVNTTAAPTSRMPSYSSAAKRRPKPALEPLVTAWRQAPVFSSAGIWPARRGAAASFGTSNCSSGRNIAS